MGFWRGGGLKPGRREGPWKGRCRRVSPKLALPADLGVERSTLPSRVGLSVSEKLTYGTIVARGGNFGRCGANYEEVWRVQGCWRAACSDWINDLEVL